MSVSERIATPDGKREYVRSLFATIADRYDLITVVLSFGLDRHWKRRLVNLAAPRPAEHALDLATGTGDLAFAIGRGCRRVVGLDVTRRMIELARAKAAATPAVPSPAPVFLIGDMAALPFPDASFELVTTGYGLRNVPDLPAAIDEIRRVLKPGGRALSLDFNRPSNALVRALYLRYLTIVGGTLGWILHGDPDTYRYIPASIRSYPGAAGVTRLMQAGGFTNVRHVRVLGGLMAIHQCFKPGGAFTVGNIRECGGGRVTTEGQGSPTRGVDTSNWSGEGAFTQILVDWLQRLDGVEFVRVEDAPASRSDADYNFISNEIFVAFGTVARKERVKRFGFLTATRTILIKRLSMAELERALTAAPGIGAPDYADDGLLQYLRTERIVPEYQTRGYKLVELVRLYEVGSSDRSRRS